jgi:hypothetical protein
LVTRHQQGDLEGLLGVEARVYGGAVSAGKIFVGKVARTASALGDIFARQFEVDATKAAAAFLVHLEGLLNLPQHLIEPTRLVALRGGLGIAMHGVGHPEHRHTRAAHGVHHARQFVCDVIGAETVDEG